MANEICTPMGGKGKLLADLLMEQLGIEKNCRGFDVHFEAGEPITVTVRRYAYENKTGEFSDVTPLTSDSRVFKLVEQENADC